LPAASGANLTGIPVSAITSDVLTNNRTAQTTLKGGALIYGDTNLANAVNIGPSGAVFSNSTFSVTLAGNGSVIDIGSEPSSQTVQVVRKTTANTVGVGLNVYAGGASVGATNKAGGTLNLSAGISTGNAGSSVNFLTALAGSSGTTDNAPVARWFLASDGTFYPWLNNTYDFGSASLHAKTVFGGVVKVGASGNTNVISDSGSLLNNIGLTNGVITAPGGLTAPDTIAWAAGSLTLGWPTLYHTHSITSNSWVDGFAGGIAGKTLTCFLTVTNATAVDYTLSVSNSVTSTDGLRSWTVTNKTSRGLSFKVGAQTNAASQPFY
jgi:hypothetical protein